MGRITTDQSHQIMAALATNASWDEIDFDEARLQDLIIRNARGAGAEFTAFLKNGARMNFGPNILRVDRPPYSQPFNPAAFLGQGWTIWRGPAEGDGLTGNEEQDKCSLALAEIDLTKIQLVTMLKPNESVIRGEEKLKRLKEAKHICLDARIFQTLWENQDRIPEAWKGKVNGNTQYIFFDGTPLRGPYGGRYVLCLRFREAGWNWYCSLLASECYSGSPSVVLVSI